MPEYLVRLRSKETNRSRKVKVLSRSYSDAEKEAERMAGDEDTVVEIHNIHFNSEGFNIIERR